MFNKVACVGFLLLVSFQGRGAEVLPDPTQPLEYQRPAIAEASLKLSSILISPRRKLAVINGVSLSEKQWIGDKQVLHIESNQVTLSQQGREIVLTLHGDKVRQ